MFVAAVLTATFMLVLSAASRAQEAPVDCPKGQGACRVVTMTEQEIQSLAGPGAIFESAVWANRAALTAVIEAWKQKIAGSPPGRLVPIDPPKETPKDATKK